MAFSHRLVTDAAASGQPPDPAPHRREHLLAQRNELRGDSFRDATVGLCALVASAAGTADPAARMRVAQRLGAEPLLQHFPGEVLRNLFEDNCSRIAMDPGFGRAYVMQEIAGVTANPAQARAVVQLALLIGSAGSEFTANEVLAVKEACQILHLDPQEFGL